MFPLHNRKQLVRHLTTNLTICTSCSLSMLSIALCITRKSLIIIQPVDFAALWSKKANSSGRPGNLSCAGKDDSFSMEDRIKSEWPSARKFDPTAIEFPFVRTKCRNCDGITSMSPGFTVITAHPPSKRLWQAKNVGL